MIQGNQAWQQALSQLQKRPLWVLEIADFGIVVASFSAADLKVGVGGYGVMLYGITGYGT